MCRSTACAQWRIPTPSQTRRRIVQSRNPTEQGHHQVVHKARFRICRLRRLGSKSKDVNRDTRCVGASQRACVCSSRSNLKRQASPSPISIAHVYVMRPSIPKPFTATAAADIRIPYSSRQEQIPKSNPPSSHTPSPTLPDNTHQPQTLNTARGGRS